MAEPSELEQKANEAPNSEKKEEKSSSNLDNVINEIGNASKNLAAMGAGAAFPFMFSGENRTNAMINGYPLMVGSMVEDMMAKKPIDTVKAAKESLVGTLLTNPLAHIFKYINITKDYVTEHAGIVPGGVAAVGSLALAQAMFVGVYTSLNHIIQNFSFKGLYEKLKKDYWPTLKNTWKYVLPLSMWNVLYIYKFGVAAQMAYSSAMSFLFRLVGPKIEGVSLKNLYSELKGYAGATFTVADKLARNTVKGVYNASSAIGGAVRDGIKKLIEYSPPKSASPAPEAAPAPA